MRKGVNSHIPYSELNHYNNHIKLFFIFYFFSFSFFYGDFVFYSFYFFLRRRREYIATHHQIELRLFQAKQMVIKKEDKSQSNSTAVAAVVVALKETTCYQ